MTKIAVVICSYEGATRVRWMLEDWMQNDPQAFARYPIHLQVDPSQNDKEHHADMYDTVASDFRLDSITHSEAWGCLHGVWREACKNARDLYDPDVVVYLGDDVGIAPDSMTALYDFIEQNDLSRIGALQPAYCNSHSLKADGTPFTHEEEQRPEFWKEANRMFPSQSKMTKFFDGHEWTKTIKRSAHYDNHGVPRTYRSANGAIWGVTRQLLDSVDIFTTHTWRADEALAYQCWTKTNLGLITVPMPPVVHFFSASSVLSKQPRHNYASAEAWEQEYGVSVPEADLQVRIAMAQWSRKPANAEAMKRLVVPNSIYNPSDYEREAFTSDESDAREKKISVSELREGHKQYWISQGIDPKLMEGY